MQSTKICVIESCTNLVMARGWCSRHYQRWYHYGDPLAGPKVRNVKPKVCSVDGCGPAGKLYKGLCAVHRYRSKKYGDPLAGPLLFTDPEERFWSKVDKSAGEDSCWLWEGTQDRRRPTAPAYGVFVANGKQYRAHRYVYMLTHNIDLNSGQPVHHTCANTLCQNPKHLQVVTQTENTAEMLERVYYLKRIEELEAELKTLKEVS